MIDTAIDGLPVIRCAWPESDSPADNGPVHTLDETAEHLATLGYPRYSREEIRQIELAALAKLRKRITQDLGDVVPEGGAADTIDPRIINAAKEQKQKRRYRKQTAENTQIESRSRRIARSKYLQKLYLGEQHATA